MAINDVVLPIARAEERYGPKPGRWKHQIPDHTNKPTTTYIIPLQPDPREELRIDVPQIPYWPEPQGKGSPHEMGYEHSYDDGHMIIIRGPDEIYRRDNE